MSTSNQDKATREESISRMMDAASPEDMDRAEELYEICRKLRAENKSLTAQRDRLAEALREIERHHVEQNKLKGRPEHRSYTLRTARAAIASLEQPV